MRTFPVAHRLDLFYRSGVQHGSILHFERLGSIVAPIFHRAGLHFNKRFATIYQRSTGPLGTLMRAVATVLLRSP